MTKKIFRKPFDAVGLAMIAFFNQHPDPTQDELSALAIRLFPLYLTQTRHEKMAKALSEKLKFKKKAAPLLAKTCYSSTRTTPSPHFFQIYLNSKPLSQTSNDPVTKPTKAPTK